VSDSQSAPWKVLLIDDDEVDRLAVRRALARRCELEEAKDAKTALELAKGKRFDVALVDYYLPPKTGLEVLKELRETQPHLVAIFLSGQGSEDVVRDAMRAGNSDYLQKAAVAEKDRLFTAIRVAMEHMQLRREAERTRARMQLAVEASGTSTWEIDVSRAEVRGDWRFAQLLELEGEGPWPLNTVANQLKEDDAARFIAAVGKGEVTMQGQKKHEYQWLDLRGRRDVDDPNKLFGTALDVTQVEESATRAAFLRERLMGIASHDLKNPLSAVLTASTMLSNSPRLDDKERRYVGHIRNAANRMSTLIYQLLDLTRVRLGGGLPLELTPTKLDEVVKRVVDEVALAFPDRKIEWEVTPVELEGDPDRLAQVVSNLLSNALRHSPVDTPVTAKLTRDGAEAMFAVCNRGKVIGEQERERIFEPFVQVGDKQSRDGLGLGLHISREIALAHGGTLTVTSDAENGTCFTMQLPLTTRAPAM
jgi:phosphoserine phosphatase RsbU/P